MAKKANVTVLETGAPEGLIEYVVAPGCGVFGHNGKKRTAGQTVYVTEEVAETLGDMLLEPETRKAKKLIKGIKDGVLNKDGVDPEDEDVVEAGEDIDGA